MRCSKGGWRLVAEGVGGGVKWGPSMARHPQSSSDEFEVVHHDKQLGAPKPHISSIRLKIQDLAPAVPIEERRIKLVVDHPQHIELLRQRQLQIQSGVSLPTAGVVAASPH